MQLSYLFTTLLAAFAVASPISTASDAAEGAQLATRATEELTAEYRAAQRAISNLQAGKFYWFTIEWDLGEVIPGPTHETPDELKQLQQQLGFDHIGLVVGQVTETKTGKGKNEKIKKDFKASLLHMTKDTKKNTELKGPNYKADRKALIRGGETSKKKVDAAKKAAKDYVAANPVYSVATNNCNTFVQTIKAVVR
ncbi:hypothetical protein GGS23DRAFT_588647 [Durotheca rogersii]|uniref:uncharacterized protein n=1 Tax=Durotheca rogersii TaxID=419775 RepID=UPI00221F92A5|nr:uncharacterized protein GGS23DRAFT_588647 [Durotheca rogersii]KAI5856792.1 hypothetical protein GGS23DRAFT_588647 [Durotheca rogersii]